MFTKLNAEHRILIEFMRKMFKIKSHSCALCKPHKTGYQNRWRAKDLEKMKIFEKEKVLIINNNLAEIDI